tara:strand:+ start:650 stop:1252 length:603 start_codon:yes stop_codon:yes gene_type:complete
MREFYFCSQKKIHKTISEMFLNFKIQNISLERLKNNNFKNQNILLIVNEDFLKNLNKSLFLKNNIVIFYATKKISNNNFLFDAKVFNQHINVTKFIDEVTTFFAANLINYGDIKILGERVINKNTEKETFLTTLEKDILISLIDQERVQKDFLLESVLKIKKDTETKTIESHLTRIRNKLSKINSNLKIISKVDRVFLLV